MTDFDAALYSESPLAVGANVAFLHAADIHGFMKTCSVVPVGID